MIHPNYRKRLKHSAKGSTWEDHKYIKRIDGTYYYPSGYDKGRTIDSLKDGDDKDKEESNIELTSEDVDSLALEVIRGNFGNGQIRKDLLGKNYKAIQDKVNELYRTGKYGDIKMSSVDVSTVEKGETAIKKAVTKVEKTQAEKGIDFSQVQSVYRKQGERNKSKAESR